MTNYEKFAKRYYASGLSQKAFAEQEGMSASMVSYYLSRNKEKQKTSFTPIQVEQSIDKNIVITTKSGTQIRIPL